MEPINGPDRPQLIEAFLMDELQARMQQVRVLRQLEQINRSYTLEQVEQLFQLQREEQDIARAMLFWTGDTDTEAKRLLLSYNRLFTASLLMRFVCGAGNKVRWPQDLKRYFATFDVDGFFVEQRLDGRCGEFNRTHADVWYTGMRMMTVNSANERMAREAWCLQSVSWLVAERVRLLESAPTDPPPPA